MFISTPYFALVQGSSHKVSSPSILYPPCTALAVFQREAVAHVGEGGAETKML